MMHWVRRNVSVILSIPIPQIKIHAMLHIKFTLRKQWHLRFAIAFHSGYNSAHYARFDVKKLYLFAIAFRNAFHSVFHAISYEALRTVLCVITDITLHTLEIFNPVVMYPKRRKQVFSTNCQTYMGLIIEIFYKYDKQLPCIAADNLVTLGGRE